MAGFLNLLSPRQKASQKQGWKPEQVRRAGGGRPQTRAVGPRTRACGRRPRRQAPAPVTGASGRRRGRRGSSVLCRLCVLPWAAAWPRRVWTPPRVPAGLRLGGHAAGPSEHHPNSPWAPLCAAGISAPETRSSLLPHLRVSFRGAGNTCPRVACHSASGLGCQACLL